MRLIPERLSVRLRPTVCFSPAAGTAASAAPVRSRSSSKQVQFEAGPVRSMSRELELLVSLVSLGTPAVLKALRLDLMPRFTSFYLQVDALLDTKMTFRV